MELESLNATFVIDTFLLLLIGIGPKIALVPFLETTRQMPQATQRRVLRKMLTTAATVAVLLLILGGLLTRLLHFSPGALGVASGIILLIIAVTMVLGQHDQNSGSRPAEDQDPMQLAVFPLAVPYLLNPAGIVVLVTASAEAACGADFQGVRLGWIESRRWAVSWDEIGELKEISAVQGNALDSLRIDSSLNHGLGEIDRVVDFGHVDDCICTGWMETDVDSLYSADLESDTVGFGNGEAGAFDLQIIGANFEGGEDVDAFCIGQGFA